MSTVSAHIRDWLSTQSQPQPMGNIRSALGLDARMCINCIAQMVRSGLLTRDGARWNYRYSVARPCDSVRARRGVASDAMTFRIHALLGELGPTTSRTLAGWLGDEGHVITLVGVRDRLAKMVRRGEVRNLSERRPRLYAQGPNAPRRGYTPEQRAEARRRKWRNDYARKQASRPAPTPRITPVAVKATPRKDRAPYQAREVATAPVRPVLPDTSAWLAANADKVQRLPPGEVSPTSRLRHDYRRQA